MARERKLLPAFRKALNCFETYTAFGDAVGVSRQVVNYWLKIKYIPSNYAVEVSKATNIPVEMLVMEAQREYERRKIAKRMRQEIAAAARWKAGAEETCEGGA